MAETKAKKVKKTKVQKAQGSLNSALRSIDKVTQRGRDLSKANKDNILKHLSGAMAHCQQVFEGKAAVKEGVKLTEEPEAA